MKRIRDQIDQRIEAYAAAVRGRNADAVAQLFAERFDHVVHGLGDTPNSPWSTKRESDREGIRKIYEGFFSQVTDMAVEYTDRVIDVEGNSAAMVVRVSSRSESMENALHIQWNEAGQIIRFCNWYGQAVR